MGVSDITAILIGMNGLSVDSPSYIYVSGNEGQEGQSTENQFILMNICDTRCACKTQTNRKHNQKRKKKKNDCRKKKHNNKRKNTTTGVDFGHDSVLSFLTSCNG